MLFVVYLYRPSGCDRMVSQSLLQVWRHKTSSSKEETQEKNIDRIRIYTHRTITGGHSIGPAVHTKKLYIHVFLLTIFDPMYCGPP